MGTVAGLNATLLAAGQGEDQDRNVILLGGGVPGWQGFRLPNGEAADQANPTLELQPETAYTLLWKNLDGVPHTFAIRDSDGNNLQVLKPILVDSEQFEALNVTAEETTPAETAPETTPPETTPAGTTTVQQVDVTQELAEQGSVQGVRFTASEDMAQYVCTVHPNSMVGEIELNEG